MAGFKVHITTSSLCGVAYGLAGVFILEREWTHATVAAALTAIGGMLPDLDSDSGIPVRELFSFAGAVIPLILLKKLLRWGLETEHVLVIAILAFLFVRYGLSRLFKRVTVHRGMFHSIPAMVLAGLAIFHMYDHIDPNLRYYMAGGIMIGFLSHLVLDEIYAVDLMGYTIKLNQFAGSALKFFSPSWPANIATYGLIFVAGAGYFLEPADAPAPAPPTPAANAVNSRTPPLIPPEPKYDPNLPPAQGVRGWFMNRANKLESPVHQIIRSGGRKRGP